MQLDVHDNSIENAVEKPAIGETIVEEAADRSIAERRIPFIAIPRRIRPVPPGARRAPRTRRPFDAAARHATPIDRDMNWTTAVDRDTNGDRGTEAAQDEGAWSAVRLRG